MYHVKKIIIAMFVIFSCVLPTEKEESASYLFPLVEPVITHGKILCTAWWSKLRTENGNTYKYKALNYPARYGSLIVSPGDGVVINTIIEGYEGASITIGFENGDSVTICHVSKFFVLDGMTVSRGQHIALVGTSGRTTGSHVRIRWQKNGDRIFCNAATWGMRYDQFEYRQDQFDANKAEMYK